MIKIRRSGDRLIFNMGIPIPEKDGLYFETGPCSRSDGAPVIDPTAPTQLGAQVSDFKRAHPGFSFCFW